LRLGEVVFVQNRTRQRIQRQGHASVGLDFLRTGDKAGAGAARQQWDARVNAENFEDLFGVGKIAGRHEYEPERHLRGTQLLAQILGPLPQAGFIEISRPVRGD
jgi:hypothetical protein